MEPGAGAKRLYVSPGRVSAAEATILALRSQIHQEFYAVMWLSLQSRRAGGPGSPTPPPALPACAGLRSGSAGGGVVEDGDDPGAVARTSHPAAVNVQTSDIHTVGSDRWGGVERR